MSRILAALAAFLLPTVLLAQVQVGAPVHQLTLYSGEQFTGKRVVYVSPILRPSQFELDGRTFPAADVAFLRNNHGYFANLNRIWGDKTERYAMRIRQGRISLFEEVDMATYGGDEIEVPEGGNEMLATGDEFGYFSMGEQPVKRATYRNLRLAIGDYPESRRELNVFRNYRILQVALVAVGAGVIAYDVTRQMDTSRSTSDGKVRFTPTLALGIVVGGSSAFLEGSKENAKWLAVDAYNAAPVP